MIWINPVNLIEILKWEDPPLLEMANLFKDDTGLDYPLWIGKIGGQHGPRIKVSNIKNKMRFNDCFVMTLDETPTIIAGECKISKNDILQICTWITKNYEDLIILWWMFEHQAISVKDEDSGEIKTYDDIIDNLKKV